MDNFDYKKYLAEGKLLKESKDSKPDFIDIDGDGDKKESMKKAAKDKEATVDEDINYDEFDEVKFDPIVKLLRQGKSASVSWGEDDLMRLSDEFEDIGDEQADEIASDLNMAIELMQDGLGKSAAEYMKSFRDVCEKQLNWMNYQGLAESVNEDINYDIDDSESYFSSQIDQIAQAEFGMDWHQLGRGEKEWVRDEIDNMNMQENEEGAKILTSRNKLEQTLNDISDELTDDQLDTISSMIVDLSSKIKKTLKK